VVVVVGVVVVVVAAVAAADDDDDENIDTVGGLNDVKYELNETAGLTESAFAEFVPQFT
jgi:hypothetical protein